MRKSELKNFVQIYAEIKNALIKRSDVVEIIKRNRKVRVKIKPWFTDSISKRRFLILSIIIILMIICSERKKCLLTN